MKNKALRQSYYLKKCIACGHTPCDPCHIKSFGSGGPDEEWNLIPLCRKHHSESHTIGWRKFAGKYAAVWIYLDERGWYFDPFGKVLRD